MHKSPKSPQAATPVAAIADRAVDPAPTSATTTAPQKNPLQPDTTAQQSHSGSEAFSDSLSAPCTTSADTEAAADIGGQPAHLSAEPHEQFPRCGGDPVAGLTGDDGAWANCDGTLEAPTRNPTGPGDVLAESAPRRTGDGSSLDSWRSQGLRARLMTPADAPATARLHLQYLPDGFFPRLGAAFVTRWHRAFIQQPHGWAAVVVDADRQVVSYALVATRHRDFVEGVIRSHGRSLAVSAIVALMGRPRLLLHFLRTRTRRYLRRVISAAVSRAKSSKLLPPAIPKTTAVVEAVVHAVVTIESARGLGCAATLLNAAEQAAQADGATVMALVTDDIPARPVTLESSPSTDSISSTTTSSAGSTAEVRQGAARFYEHLGWTRTAERWRDGRRILEYQRRIKPQHVTATTHDPSAPTTDLSSVHCPSTTPTTTPTTGPHSGSSSTHR